MSADRTPVRVHSLWPNQLAGPSTPRRSSGPPDMILFRHNAATPATCGVAMLVPFKATRPPPSLAEKIPTPGPETLANVFEKGATVSPAPDSPKAATDTMPSATAGGATAIS